MFELFRKKLDHTKVRKVLLKERDDTLHLATAKLTDCGWVATDPWGSLQILTEKVDSVEKCKVTKGSHRIVGWFPHTGWDTECFLEKVDG